MGEGPSTCGGLYMEFWLLAQNWWRSVPPLADSKSRSLLTKDVAGNFPFNIWQQINHVSHRHTLTPHQFIGEEGDVWNTWWEQPSFSLSAFSFIFLCQFCTSTVPLIVLVSSCLKKNPIGSNALQLKTYLTKGQEKESGKFWLFIRSGDGHQVFQQSPYITSDHALARPRFKGGQLFFIIEHLKRNHLRWRCITFSRFCNFLTVFGQSCNKWIFFGVWTIKMGSFPLGCDTTYYRMARSSAADNVNWDEGVTSDPLISYM